MLQAACGEGLGDGEVEMAMQSGVQRDLGSWGGDGNPCGC